MMFKAFHGVFEAFCKVFSWLLNIFKHFFNGFRGLKAARLQPEGLGQEDVQSDRLGRIVVEPEEPVVLRR